MKRFFQQLKSKTFRTIMTSYFFILILPFLALVIILLWISVSMEKGVEESQQLILEQYRSSIDSQIFNLIEQGDLMTTDPAITLFSQRSEAVLIPYDRDFFDMLRNTSRALVSSIEIGGVVKNVYLYLPESESFFSTKGIMSTEWFYRAHFSSSEYTESEILRKLAEVQSTGLMALSDISYVIKLSTKYSRPVILVLELNPEALSQTAAIHSQEMQFFIINKSGEVIYATSSDLSIPGSLSGYKSGDMINGVVYHFTYSPFTGCTYYLSAPNTVYRSQINMVRMASLLIIGLLLFSCVLLIILLARRAYEPVNSILRLFGQPDMRQEKSHDEFMAIHSAVKKMSFDNENMKLNLLRQSKALGGAVISRLMFGNYIAHDTIEEDLALSGLFFYGDYFCVMLVWADESLDGINDSSKLLNVIAANVYEDLLSALCYVKTTTIEMTSAFLLNMKSAPSESFFDGLVCAAKQGSGYIQENYGINIYVTISHIHTGFEGVKTCYREAEMLRSQTNSNCRILSASSLAQARPATAAFLTEESETKLTNLLIIGNFEGAKAIINDAIQKTQSPWEFDILLPSIFACILKAISHPHFSAEDISEINIRIGLMLNDNMLSETMVYDTIKIISDLSQKNNPANQSIEKRVRDYVSSNYTNTQLTVASIAEYLGLHVNYLSSVYKKQSGESLLECIIFYRLARAKKLLLENDLSIKEIANLCGFSNNAGLARAFKKNEGITPGQFRDCFKKG